ncbi:hypothetical protein [Streptodolium elevatio]|uniref:SH3 domain-containing protein n=1 Tax=Streptodolium elevatio TaxID=3157996 RepID=A0ABV3DMZ8_9ACTN
MLGGGIRERLRLRREVAAADGTVSTRRRPGVLTPVLLIVFFLVVVLMVVKMGGGEDNRTTSTGDSREADADPTATEEATTTISPTAPAGSVPGTVRSRLALAVYKQASAKGKPVLSADHGTSVMVVCHTAGQTQYTNGKADPTWARIIVSGKVGYAHVGQLDTGGVIITQVPNCSAVG